MMPKLGSLVRALWLLSVLVFVNEVSLSVVRNEAGSSPPAVPFDSVLGNFSSAAIAIDGRPCAKIGMDVLRRGGHAVDAAVAALFCNGLFNSHSMGVGGGFLMTIYVRATGEVMTLNAREAAPAYAHKDMFDGDTMAPQYGPFAIGIPGQIQGLWDAKDRYGNEDITWSSLIQPSIEMCRNGIEVGFSLAAKMLEFEADIRRDPGLTSVFINPETDAVWQEGDFFLWEDLAMTLERVAENGAREFYTGVTAINLVEDIREWGGNITMEDLAGYESIWSDPISVDLGHNLTLFSVPPPGSGVILAYILNILKHYDITPEDGEYPLLFHRVSEAWKWAYASRTTLGDPSDDNITELIHGIIANLTSEDWAFSAFSKINDTFTVNNASYYGADFYTPEDHGTAHVSILGPNGDAVSITSTVNTEFGTKFMSRRTGVILNNEMDDFSYPNVTNYFGVPPSPNNFVRPGKRPMSSMCPAIVVDVGTGEARLVVGAAGGTKITTATTLVALRNLWLGEDIKTAIDNKRIHHQLAPMEVRYEAGLDQNAVDLLVSREHEAIEHETYLAVVQRNFHRRRKGICQRRSQEGWRGRRVLMFPVFGR